MTVQGEKTLQKSCNFQIKTSSSRFLQSNEMVKRYLQTVKYILKKADFDNRNPYLALLEYRNTLISNNIPSTSDLLFGHKINGIMPCKDFFPY